MSVFYISSHWKHTRKVSSNIHRFEINICLVKQNKYVRNDAANATVLVRSAILHFIWFSFAHVDIYKISEVSPRLVDFDYRTDTNINAAYKSSFTYKSYPQCI